MLRLGEGEIAKKVLCCKKTIQISDDNVDSIVVSKLVTTKTNSMYFIWYLDKTIRPLVLILPKMSGYVKTFKVKEGDKDKNNKLLTFHIDDEKVLEKYKLFGLRLKIWKILN